jgi:Tfp pilus assembly protein PilO
MIDRATIQKRRDALAAQLEQGRQQYDQLEATLKELDRQLCAMSGGVQELDALLAVDGDAAEQHGSERQQPADLRQHDDQDQLHTNHDDLPTAKASV